MLPSPDLPCFEPSTFRTPRFSRGAVCASSVGLEICLLMCLPWCTLMQRECSTSYVLTLACKQQCQSSREKSWRVRHLLLRACVKARDPYIERMADALCLSYYDSLAWQLLLGVTCFQRHCSPTKPQHMPG